MARTGREDPTGVQGRLANLGHYVGPIDGKLGDETEHAIVSFQRAHALPPTGEPDEVFRATLRTAHGA